MATRFAWGIDVGNRALKAVKLVPDGTGFRIDDFECIEHETVLSNSGDNREQLIQTALANFVQRHPQKGGIAGIGVSGQQSFARFIKLPPVEERKIPEIVRFEAIQQIPFPLDDVEWSYQLFREPESPDVEVGIFAMRKELIARHISYFTDVDLNVQVVQMNPLAVYNAMYHDGQIEGTTMIIDLGAENADLIIAEGETIWLRSIPIGGNNFTEALVKAFKLDFTKAEDLKRNAATSKYARQIMQAMKPVFADLVGEIQRSIGFYASVHRDSRINKVLALGGTFRLPSLQKYIAQNLQLEVHKVDRLAATPPADPKLGTAYNDNLLSSVSAYGLALQALNQGKITSSLLPAAIKREKVWRDKTKWFGAAAALFVLGTGIKIGSAKYEELKLANADADQRRIADIQGKVTAADGKWTTVENDGGPDRQLILNIKSLENYRHLWDRLLVDIRGALVSANPQPELLSGDPAKIKAIPRNQRRQVFLEDMKTVYRSDLSDLLAASPSDFKNLVGTAAGAAVSGAGGRFGPPGTPGAPGEEAAAAPAEKQRGYLITLRLRTPNSGRFSFVDSTLIKSLLAIDLKSVTPDRRYYVARAGIITSSLVSAREGAGTGFAGAGAGGAMAGRYPGGAPGGYNPTMGRAIRPGMPNPGMGLAGRPPMPSGNNAGNMQADPTSGAFPRPQLPAETAAAMPVDPLTDPVTGEDMRQDSDITVAFVVVLDPPAPAPAAAAPAEAAMVQ